MVLVPLRLESLLVDHRHVTGGWNRQLRTHILIHMQEAERPGDFSSNKATPPNLSQTVPLTRNQAFKSSWGTLSKLSTTELYTHTHTDSFFF